MRARLVAAVAGLALCACSALGLTDVTPQEQGCRDCTELNLVDPPPACMSWQCDRVNQVCVLDTEDLDDDDAQSAACVLEGEPDCDDLDPRNAPGLGECLDGQDNDCDEAIDEELFARVQVGGARADVGPLAWTSDGAIGLFVTPSPLALSTWSGGAVAALTGDPPVGSNITSVAAARLNATRPDELLVAYDSVANLCPRVTVGRAAMGVFSEMTDAAAGLPKLGSGQRCPDATTRVFAPSVAHDGERDAVALWLEGDADREACGAEASPVGAIQLEVTPAVAPVGTDPVAIGSQGGLGGVPVVAIGASTFVAALTSASGEVQLLRLTAGASLEAAAHLHTETACGAGCGRAALSVREGELGLAYRAGGCDDAEIRVRRFAIDGADLRPIGDTIAIDAGDVSRLALAPIASGWAVAWSEGRALRYAEIGAGGVSPIALAYEQTAAVTTPLGLEGGEDVVLRSYDANPGLLDEHRRVPCALP